jgi:hypothetical protein
LTEEPTNRTHDPGAIGTLALSFQGLLNQRLRRQAAPGSAIDQRLELGDGLPREPVDQALILRLGARQGQPGKQGYCLQQAR